MKLQYSIEIGRPAQEVFAFVASHERMPSWISTLETSTPKDPGQLGLGSEFSQEHTERGKRIQFEGKVTEFDSASRLTLELVNADATVTIRYRFEESSSGTLLEQTTEVKLNNMMLRMMAGAFEGTVRERMATDFATLRSQIEA